MNKILTVFRNPRNIIFAVVSVLLFVATLFGVRAFVRNMQIVNLPGVSINPAQPTAENAPDLPTPGPVSPPVDLPPAWDGASRINMILLGVDTRRDVDDGPPRADTVLVITIDPQSKTAGMISIPRDMWVNVPGFGYGRINTAYALGEGSKLPGGGPMMTARTVEQFLGIPIHYYGQVDFMTFVHLVDNLGGIDVEVRQKVTIDPLGPGEDNRVIPQGLKRMDGMIALAYARARKTEGGDVDRAKRQQAVILAMRNKALDPANFPALLARAPQIYQDLQSGINTNMSFDDAIRLAVLLQQINPDEIKRGVIDYTMVNLETTNDGQMIFKPFPDKIRELRDEIFTSEGAASPAASGSDLADLMRQENARVLVRNGTYTQGLGTRSADYFKTLGVNVVGSDNASEVTSVTRIIDNTGSPYALQYFRELFKVTSNSQIILRYDPNAAADVEIILGDDWAFNNPMP
ncbi:MAG: LCP family protein [Anaerolineales bacterium]|jgi:LCP family protein required for cell wall assembly|nr:LCP family protein [Anaerolineales bacterium]